MDAGDWGDGGRVVMQCGSRSARWELLLLLGALYERGGI